MSREITPGTLPDSDARLLRTPYDRARIGLPCESGRLNETNRHMLDLAQISDRVEVSITRASEQQLPTTERRGIYPTSAHEDYVRRATAETDRLPIVPYRLLPFHVSIKQQPWRPLHDWRFLGCASLGLSLAAFGGYCVGLPSLATLCLVMAGILALNMWRVK